MLPHYSSYKVAENFRMLETLFPGRIDLGIGRAPGSDQRTMRILADGKPNWSNADQLSDPGARPRGLAARCGARQACRPRRDGAAARRLRARRLAAGLERRQCGARRAFRPAVLLRALHQSRRRRRRHAVLSRAVQAFVAPSRTAGDDGDGRDVRGDRRRSRPPVQEPRALGDAAAHHERARPVPAGRGGAGSGEGSAHRRPSWRAMRRRGVTGSPDDGARRHRGASPRATRSTRSCW